MTQQELFSTRPAPAPDAGPRYTPVELARLLHQPAPTAQQVEVIAHPGVQNLCRCPRKEFSVRVLYSLFAPRQSKPHTRTRRR